MNTFLRLHGYSVYSGLEMYSVAHQLSDIGPDDQISEVGIRSVIYQTRYFAPNILRDNYAVLFFSGSQVKTKI